VEPNESPKIIRVGEFEFWSQYLREMSLELEKGQPFTVSIWIFYLIGLGKSSLRCTTEPGTVGSIA
jgi:hypothetical protein